jgi:molecular chaperone DnaK
VGRVLVDVSPYSFGISFLGERGGVPYPHCYKPIIRRNTPLPLTRTEQYVTSYPFQTDVDLHIYQGEDDDALKNILVGDFRIEGLNGLPGPNEILCRMRLDLDGILEVAAVEKRTGKSKQITIANALAAKSPEEIAAARKRSQELFESRSEKYDESEEDYEEIEAEGLIEGEFAAAASLPGEPEAADLVERSRKLLDKMHQDDREEAIDLHERIGTAIESGDAPALAEASRALKELLFFMEGRAN